VIRFTRVFVLIAFLSLQIALQAQESKTDDRSISLPTSKTLTMPTPGRIGSTNSFPAMIDQSGWPLCRAAERWLWHAGDHGHAVDCGA
jgi:hypothetical protein